MTKDPKRGESAPTTPIGPDEHLPASNADAATEPADSDEAGALGRVGELLGDAADAVVDRASTVVGGAVHLAQGAARRWDERPGARVRRIRRLGRLPLPFLYDVHPEARRASPRELGLKTVDVDQIAGTAVGGAVQRGADFLPMKAFRSLNWNARWQRLRRAADRLAILPPIDVILYHGRYWVLDGHNRVGLALYTGQVSVDANVVELVAPGERSSEPAGALAPVLEGTRALRTAGEGRRPSTYEDEHAPEHLHDQDEGGE